MATTTGYEPGLGGRWGIHQSLDRALLGRNETGS